jgi:hypothetical protein
LGQVLAAVPYVLIFGFALVLLFYWLRYNCLLFLRSGRSRNYARQVAQANHLSFPEVEEQLEAGPSGERLRELYQAVRRDYRILSCLLRYTAAWQGRSYRFGQSLLAIDFRLMQFTYGLTAEVAPVQARRALRESVQILARLANLLAERAAVAARV